MKKLTVALVGLALAGLAAAEEVVVPDEPAPNEAKPVKRAQPQYPRPAAERRVEGCVVVAVDVGPDGVGQRFAVLDSQPAGVFDAATLKALRDWRWEKDKAGWVPQRLEYRMSPNGRASLPCIDMGAARARIATIPKP